MSATARRAVASSASTQKDAHSQPARAARLAADCGGSSGSTVAEVDSSTTTTDGSASAENPQAAYAVCMRRNGAPDFPDPDSQGRFNLTPQLPRQTPGLSRATEACEHLKRAAFALDPELESGRRA